MLFRAVIQDDYHLVCVKFSQINIKVSLIIDQKRFEAAKPDGGIFLSDSSQLFVKAKELTIKGIFRYRLQIVTDGKVRFIFKDKFPPEHGFEIVRCGSSPHATFVSIIDHGRAEVSQLKNSHQFLNLSLCFVGLFGIVRKIVICAIAVVLYLCVHNFACNSARFMTIDKI